MPAILWEDHSDQVMRLVAKFYKNGEFTDCMLELEGGTIHCHKTILAACSSYLKKLFDNHKRRLIIPMKEVKYNDMNHILDYIYFGEVEVPVTDMASFKAAAELLQISSLRCAFLNFSEESWTQDVSEESTANCNIDLIKQNERNLCVKENTVIRNPALDQLAKEGGLNSCCQEINAQLIGDSKTKTINTFHELPVKESEDKPKVSTPSGSGIEMDLISEGPENLQDDLLSINFVAVSPVSVKSEGHENEQSVCDSELKNPLELSPNIYDVISDMNIKEEEGFHSEAERNIEVKGEFDVCELGFEAITNLPFSEKMQNNSGSGTVLSKQESEHSSDEGKTVGDNYLSPTEHAGGILNNLPGTNDGTANLVSSEECAVHKTEDLETMFDSVSDVHESDLKKVKQFECYSGLKKKFQSFVLYRMKSQSKAECNNSASNKSCELSTKESEQIKEKDLKKRYENTFTSPVIYDHQLPSHSEPSFHLSDFTSTEGLVQASCDFLETSPTEHFLNGKKVFRCEACGAEFSAGSRLKRHMFSHTGEKPFLCDICGKAFRMNSTFVNHRLIHTGEKPYTCEVCNASFRQAISLDRHRRLHTGEKPYVCDVCGRTFISKPSLAYHIQTHTGEKPHTCSMCNASFRGRSALTNHMRSHTGDTPFSCHLCQDSFCQSGQLKIHLLKHTGNKPFVCCLCEKSYWTKSQLKEHVNDHVGVKPFSCTLCEASYSQRKSLWKHALKHKNGKK